MLKATLAIINLLGLFLLGLFSGDVSVSDNTPESMSPGSSVLVEIAINKSTISGFAKLQIELPPGLTATPVETQGASFTFAQGKAKFIWMTLPDDAEFVVKYNLKAASDASGQKMITSTFSYIKDNNRVDYNITPRSVMIGESLSQAERTNVSADSDGDNRHIETAQTTEIEEAIALSETISNESQDVPEANSNCSRDITELNSGVWQVKVSISQLDLSGYAKVQESVPAGFSITNRNSGGAVVTIEGSVIKYVWFQAPESESFEVIYNLSSENATAVPDISGAFYYVLDNKPETLAISTSGVERAEPLAVETPEPKEQLITEIPVSEPVAVSVEPAPEPKIEVLAEVKPEVTPSQQNHVAETAPIEASQKENKMTSVPAPQTGVTYSVQLVAGPNTVGKSYFISRHNFNGKFNIENHEGWVKYTTGSHNEYKDARNERENIRRNYNFDGPFVTAYNRGERITVQEALMITQQNWVQ